MRDVGPLVAFGAGLLSFLSPCVLPLIPGYLSFLSGRSSAELRDGKARAGVFMATLFFALGFSAVFVGLGLAFSGGGMLLAGGAARTAAVAAGVALVLLGLNMIFDFIRALNFEKRFRLRSKPAGAAGAFLVGMAFGAGWTPCIGPILTAILFMAARSETALASAFLLAAYSAGLALPFLAAGLFFERLSPLMDWWKRRGKAVRVASGAMLVAIGLFMALGRLGAASAALVKAGMAVKSFAARDPAGAKAWSLALPATLAALLVALPLIGKKRFLRPWRMVALSLLAALLLLEATGAVSLLGLLSDWLLFQGA